MLVSNCWRKWVRFLSVSLSVSLPHLSPFVFVLSWCTKYFSFLTVDESQWNFCLFVSLSLSLSLSPSLYTDDFYLFFNCWRKSVIFLSVCLSLSLHLSLFPFVSVLSLCTDDFYLFFNCWRKSVIFLSVCLSLSPSLSFLLYLSCLYAQMISISFLTVDESGWYSVCLSVSLNSAQSFRLLVRVTFCCCPLPSTPTLLFFTR